MSVPEAVSEVEYEVSRFVRQNDGMFIRVERDRFLAVIEERNMKQICGWPLS